jgi:hypothetical protein
LPDRFFTRPCPKPATARKTVMGKRGTPCKSALLFGTYRINDLLTNGRSRWIISTTADAHDASARFRRSAGLFLTF